MAWTGLDWTDAIVLVTGRRHTEDLGESDADVEPDSSSSSSSSLSAPIDLSSSGKFPKPKRGRSRGRQEASSLESLAREDDQAMEDEHLVTETIEVASEKATSRKNPIVRQQNTSAGHVAGIPGSSASLQSPDVTVPGPRAVFTEQGWTIPREIRAATHKHLQQQPSLSLGRPHVFPNPVSRNVEPTFGQTESMLGKRRRW